MYPYITIWDIKIYMMGLGIVVALLTFLIVIRRYSKLWGLNYHLLLKKLPLYLIIVYLCGTYTYYLINELVVFPLNWEHLLLYLTPYGYKFHYIGILIGICFSGYLFLKPIPPQQRPLRMSAIGHGILLALVPLGVGLVLGDNFIGQMTQGDVYVSAILDDSGLAAFDRVIPLGLYVSIFGLLSHLAAHMYEQKKNSPKGYLILAWVLIGFSFLLLYQQYPRHLVTRAFGKSRDIKQYVSFGLALWFFVRYLTFRKRKLSFPTV